MLMPLTGMQARLHGDNGGAAPQQAVEPTPQSAGPDPQVAPAEAEQPADGAAAASAPGQQPAAQPNAAQSGADHAGAPAAGAAAAGGASEDRR